MTVAPIMMVIGRLMMFKNVARTSQHFPLLSIQGMIGVGLASWAWTKNPADTLPLILASVGLVGFLFYAYWYSSFGRKVNAKLKVGTTLPPFKLTDVNNRVVQSSLFIDRPIIMIFFRGNWCPLCMAQIKEITKKYSEINKMGVRVALISPQPHKNTIALAKKFNVKFKFFTDVKNETAQALGIALPNGLPFGMNMMGYKTETVLPTVIIADSKGKIIWTHETDNYRVRPEPELFLNILRKNNLVTAAVS